MNFSKILLTAAIATCLTAAPAFAASSEAGPATTETSGQQKNDTLKNEKNRSSEKESKQQDPIKALEAKKEKVQTLLKEGKITKEEANEITTRLDSRIKEINEFNKLTLNQKKEKLTSNFKASLEKRVSEGKVTQERADKALKIFTEKIEKWDGNGYPPFNGKGFKHGKCPSCKDK